MGKGIIGTKLGMTQLFDQESGRVTPVTVIEAGPCPVVAVRTPEADGYTRRPARVRAGQGEEADPAAGRPSQGRRRGAAPHAGRVPERRRAGTPATRSRWSLRAGRAGQGQRRLPRQGLRRHDQAAPVLARPGLARLAQRPRAGIDRRVGDAVARVQGHQDGRPDGVAAGHPARPARGRGRHRAQSPAGRGRRPRRAPAAISKSGATADGRPDRTRDHRRRQGEAGRGRVRTGAKRRARARGREGRAGRAPAGHARRRRRAASWPGGRAKPWRQKGTGRARAGTTRAPHWTGGGVVFGPHPRNYTGKVNRKARMKALRIAALGHAAAGSLHVVDGGGVRRAQDVPAPPSSSPSAEPAGARVGGGRAATRSTWPSRSATSTAPTSRTSASWTWPTSSWRARWSSRRRRWPCSRAVRARERRPPLGADRARRVGEELRPDRRPAQVHVSRAQERPQDPGAPGGRGDLRRQRHPGEHLEGARQAQAARRPRRPAAGLEEGGRDGRRGPVDRSVRTRGSRGDS